MKFLKAIDKFYSEHTAKAAAITTIVLIAGFCFLYWSVEVTSTPQFCISCHEIKPQYNAWKKSTHYNITGNNPNIKSREVAKCRDCHLPTWRKPVSLLWAKAYHGTKDIYHHYTDKNELKHIGYYYNMRITARKEIPNENCLKCHKDILEFRSPDIKFFHGSLLYNKHVSCLQCHKNMVHGKLKDIQVTISP